MNGKPIVFFDSGIGGLPYLAWVRDHAPAEQYIYLADRNNFPYGEKSTSELTRLILDSMELLVGIFNPKLVVIACNTASVVALSDLRQKFGIPFIGVVPAVKPAAESSENKKIGLYATERTINDTYTDTLIERFGNGNRFEKLAGPDLVDFIERRYGIAGTDEELHAVAGASDFFRGKEVDTVVLGCTHFIFLKPALETALGGKVRIIDSREGVGKQVLRIMEKEKISSAPGFRKDMDYFYITAAPGLTGNETEMGRYRELSRIFLLEWGGVVPAGKVKK